MTSFDDSRIYVVAANMRRFSRWHNEIVSLPPSGFKERLDLTKSYLLNKQTKYAIGSYAFQGLCPGYLLLADGWESNNFFDIVNFEMIVDQGWRICGDKYYISTAQWDRFKGIEKNPYRTHASKIAVLETVPIQKISRFEIMDI